MTTPTTRPILSLARAAAAALGFVAAAATQCQTQWLTMPGIPTGWRANAAVEWDPDQGGPLPALLVVGGWFPSAGGVAANNVAAWDPTTNTWSALGAGTDSEVFALHVRPGGELIVAGRFTTAGTVTANRIASWDGTSWSALGSGIGGANNPSVGALATMPDGDLVVGGAFDTAGGAPAFAIARWDGSGWSALMGGMNASVDALLVLPNGDLVAGGYFAFAGGMPVNRIARWDGSSWSPLGAGPGLPISTWVSTIVRLPDGDLVVGTGDFPFFMGTPVVRALRWDGSSWTTIGTSTAPFASSAVIKTLAVLPDGDLLAGGDQGQGLGDRYLSRWNGSSWSAVTPAVRGPVNAIAPLGNGELAVGGTFVAVGSTLVDRVARLTTTCPAAVSPAGAGCAGSAGPNELTATNLPWTGSTFRATATGMPGSSFAVSLFGLTATATPLSTLLPQGVAGCTLHVSTESIRLLVPLSGSVNTELPIPNSVAFAGVVLRHQVVAAELDPQLMITAVTSTNALALTVGSF